MLYFPQEVRNMLKKILVAIVAVIMAIFMVYCIVNGEPSVDEGRWDDKIGVGDWME